VNKRIGFVVVSTLFLFVVLSIPLAFPQPWDTCVVNVQATAYSFCGPGENFAFEVIAPQAGTPNTIVVTGTTGNYTMNLDPGDLITISLGGITQDLITYDQNSGHLMYEGMADSVTVNELEIPEFSSFLIVPLFVIASLLAVIVLRRKLTS
jgi:hypothetical protein